MTRPRFLNRMQNTEEDIQKFKDALADLRERCITEEEIVLIREDVLDPLNRFGDIPC